MEPPQKKARYLDDDDDDEQLEAENKLFQKWRQRLSPGILRILFRAGYRTETMLENLLDDDLAAAARFLKMPVPPGLAREFELHVHRRTEHELSDDDDDDESHHAEQSDDEMEDEDDDFDPVFDPKLRKYTAPLELLHRTRVGVVLDWSRIYHEPSEPPPKDGGNTNLSFAAVGRRWALRVTPRKAIWNAQRMFSINLMMEKASKTADQPERPEGYPVNYVLQLLSATGHVCWKFECHTVFDQRGGSWSTVYPNKRFIKLEKCGDGMTIMLHFRCYKSPTAVSIWKQTPALPPHENTSPPNLQAPGQGDMTNSEPGYALAFIESGVQTPTKPETDGAPPNDPDPPPSTSAHVDSRQNRSRKSPAATMQLELSTGKVR